MTWDFKERIALKLRLREMREAQSLSQAALAQKAGLGLSTVNRLELGIQSPTWKTLHKLAAALGVEPGELVVRE